jgi:hypothetical protein
MKCHKCGFVSFDYLSDCKKCGVNLEGSRSILGMLDIKPTMPFFLGAMINARPAGANGGSAGLGGQTADAPGFADLSFGGDLEFEIEEDAKPVSAQTGARADQDIFPDIDLPEGFSLSFGEEEKADDFELVIGPEFEQALTLELNAKDLEDQGAPVVVADELADLQIDEPLLDLTPELPAEELKVGEVEPLTPELALDISFEPNDVAPLLDSKTAEEAPENGEDGLVIDFSRNELEGLLLELDDKKPEA